MNMEKVLLIVTLLIFLVPVAIFIPAFMAESTSDEVERVFIMNEGDTDIITKDLEMSIYQITSTDVEISLFDGDNAETDTQIIDDGKTHTFEFENGDIDVTVTGIKSNDRVVITTELSTTYAWDSSEERTNEAMPYIVIIPIFLVVFMVVYSIMRDNQGVEI